MRVLVTHNRYRFAGGEERHVEMLEAWLPRTGIEVSRFEVASPVESSFLERLRLGGSLTYRPAGARLMRRALLRAQPDLAHFHNIHPLLTPSAFREAQRHGVRVVLTIHNYRFACPSATLLRNARLHDDCIDGSSLLCGLRNVQGAWAENVAYGIALELQRRFRLHHRWVDAYIAPSKFIAALLTRAGYPEERIHVIPHGTPAAREPSSGGDYALYLGRLSGEKGIKTLLSASRLAVQVPVVIAGDGPLASIVHAARLPKLSYAGRVDTDEARRLIQGARFTLAPSEWFENQPYAVIEAMGAGKAVIATHLGGLPELITDGVTGMLIPPRDPLALANAMTSLWHDENLTTVMGTNAWRRVRNHYSPLAQARRITDLYEHLLDSRVRTG
jgi:glycosyltransferase involved in cell wall biosynthesis